MLKSSKTDAKNVDSDLQNDSSTDIVDESEITDKGNLDKSNIMISKAQIMVLTMMLVLRMRQKSQIMVLTMKSCIVLIGIFPFQLSLIIVFRKNLLSQLSWIMLRR